MRKQFHLRTAFTIMELMVVVIILVIVMLIAIPSFSAMMYSTESSTAEGLLRAAVRAGRDAALRSGGDADAAVVFFYEPGGRLMMVPCVKVGTLDDADRSDNINTHVVRDVFVPATALQPTQMPRHWMVRGYVPPNMIDSGAAGDWYESGGGLTRYEPVNGNWVFPETGFFDIDDAGHDEGHNRQTFMLRFEAGTGVMKVGAAEEALVLSPRASSRFRPPQNVNVGWANAYQADDYPKFVQRVLADPSLVNNGTAAQLLTARRNTLGARSADMVLARPVGQVALYDEKRLAVALGARTDPVTGCLYIPWSTVDSRPTFVKINGTPISQPLVNQWIQGDTDLDTMYESISNQTGATLDQPEARLYSIDRNTAAIRTLEVQP